MAEKLTEQERTHPRPVAAGFDVEKDAVPTGADRNPDNSSEKINNRTVGGSVIDSDRDAKDAAATKKSAQEKAEQAGDKKAAATIAATAKAEGQAAAPGAKSSRAAGSKRK